MPQYIPLNFTLNPTRHTEGAEHKGKLSKHIRMPITSPVLDKLRQYWDDTKHNENTLLWAVSVLCFTGYFWLGELLPTGASREALS